MSERKIAVVAIGGNSLIKDKSHQTVMDQYLAAQETTHHIGDMIQAGWDVAISHGNGPQVGFILRRSEIAHHVEGLHELPLDVCGADSQGGIGYSLQQNMRNELFKRKIDKSVVTLITQVLVDQNDPAFDNPSKPIGSFMTEIDAKQRMRDMGWACVDDAGRGWRRVVPSPLPKEVVELEAVKTLLANGTLVITVGGGGIPVIEREDGTYQGIAAVIDKDYASALLATSIQADLMLISTSVEKVALNYRKPEQIWLDQITLSEARRLLEEGTHFARGSMAPKIEAILWYLEAGGKEAIITNPENIGRALRKETGTWIVHD